LLEISDFFITFFSENDCMKVVGCDIVRRIDEILQKKSMVRKNVLIALGLNSSSFTDWSKRGTIPSADKALAVADYLGVPLRWLLTGEDETGLAPDERDVLNSYRRLDDRDRQEVGGIITLKLSRYEQSYEQGEKALA
jgi:transcriptional regulator with XRE-family HTH domain